MSDRRLGRPRDGRSDPYGGRSDPFGGGFGGDLGGFGGGGGSNPFELMNSRMSQMDQMMSQMCGGSMLGGRGSMLGGGLLGQMDQMMSAGGGSGLGGGSCCSSSYCCSSSSAGGRTVQYSQSSHGVRQPGQEWVSETQKNYRDSAGAEKIGVSRTIGNRGRSIVAERGADGTERRTDNVRGYEDGSAFDRDWQGNAGAATIAQSRTAHRSLAGPGGAASSAFYGRPAAVGYRAEPPQRAPTQTDADRAAAREGRAHYEREQRRMIDEAQRDRQRQGQDQSQSGVARVGYRHGGGGADDARLAQRYAREEARRAGMH